MKKIFYFLNLSLLIISDVRAYSTDTDKSDLYKYDHKVKPKKSEIQAIDPATKRCPEIKEDLKRIRNAQLNYKLEKGHSLDELNKMYDKEMANYVLYKGIKDLKADFVKHSEELKELHYGKGNPNALSSKEPNTGDVAHFLNQAKAVENTADSMMKIAALSGLLNELHVTPGAKNSKDKILPLEGFMAELENKCRSNSKLSLCQILGKKEEDPERKKLESVLKGFHDTFVIATEGEDEAKKDQKMAELSALLADKLPAGILDGSASEKIKDLSDKTAELKEKLKNANIEKFATNAEFASHSSEYQVAFGGYAKYLGDFSKSDFYGTFVKQVKLDEHLGALRDASDVLEKRKKNLFIKPQTVKNILAKFYQQKRLEEYREREKNPKKIIETDYNIEKMGLSDLYKILAEQGNKACPKMEKSDEGLALCLASLSEDKIDHLLNKSQNGIKSITRKIKELQEDQGYQSLNKMQKALSILGQDVCKKTNDSFKIIQCTGISGNGVWSEGPNQVNFLLDSTGQIISALDPFTKNLKGDRLKAIKDLSDACANWKISSLAGETCYIARTNQKEIEKPTYEAYQQKREREYYSNGRKRPGFGEIFATGFFQSVAKYDQSDLTGLGGSGGILPWFMGSYLPSVNQEEYGYNIGIMQKQQNYINDIYTQQQFAYLSGANGFPGYNFGSYGTTPYGFNQSTSTSFQVGNAGLYRSSTFSSRI